MEEHGNIPALRRYIQELYVVVFEFFTQIFTKWSKSGWKRFLISFDESAFNRLFPEKRSRILAIERRMEQHITLDFQHKMEMSMEKVVQYQQEVLTRLPVNLVQSQQELLTPMQDKVDAQRRFLGSSLQLLLEQQKSWMTIQPYSLSSANMVEDSPEDTPQATTDETGPITPPEPDIRASPQNRHRFNRAEIQAELTVLTRRLRNQVEQLTQAANQASLLQIDKQVHHRLTTWLRRVESTTSLWIRGPHDVSRPSQNSMTAVSLAALARANDIPCIFYFCTLTDRVGSEIPNEEALKALLASIVTQLTYLMPEHGYSKTDLSPLRFIALTQNRLTVDETLQLIRDVREIGPRYVHGFIDNLQVLEDRSNRRFTRDLLKSIEMLCNLYPRSQPRGNSENQDELVMKRRICFTIDGYMDGLAQAVDLKLATKVEFDLETSDSVKAEVGGMIE